MGLITAVRRLFAHEVKLAGDTNARRLPMRGSGGGFSDVFDNLLWGRRQDADYRKVVADVTQNSAVAQCIGWIAANWPQAMPEVRRKNKEGRWEAEPHPLTGLLLSPSPFYSARDLWKGVIRDFFGPGRGNAYAYIVCGSGGNGKPIELQYLPARCTKPVGSGGELISWYEYRPNGGREVIRLPRERVLHFRNGIDPDNPALGVDPLSAALPEIGTDTVATRSQFDLLARSTLR